MNSTASKIRLLLLLSGPISVGKSSVASSLKNDYKFLDIKTGTYLRNLAAQLNLSDNRTALQELGDSLDIETDYKWLIDDIAVPIIHASPHAEFWLLDSVRKKRQVEHFRTRFGPVVFHIHLTAPEVELQKRYEARLSRGEEYTGNLPYETAIAHSNEVSSRELISIAEQTIDTSRTSPKEIGSAILRMWKCKQNICDRLS